jgi:hypothetical protein
MLKTTIHKEKFQILTKILIKINLILMLIQNNFIKIKPIDLKKNKHSDKKKISLIKIIHLIDLIVKFKSNCKKVILLLFEQANLSVKVLQE